MIFCGVLWHYVNTLSSNFQLINISYGPADSLFIQWIIICHYNYSFQCSKSLIQPRRSPIKLASVSFLTPLYCSLNISFFSGITKYFRLIVAHLCFSPGISLSPGSPASSEWKIIFWNHNLGTRCAHYCWSAAAFGLSQGTARGYMYIIYTHLHLYLFLYLYVTKIILSSLLVIQTQYHNAHSSFFYYL